MSVIRQLPPSVVNKIAAGEVIERPASVVKELMENSVDAGAMRVDVAVEQGGLELVRIVDDGCGMASDDLPMAVASHATSKLSHADDLFRVRTLGFRGEALASIAEVSRFLIRSRLRDSAAGSQLDVNGGESHGVSPCGCGVGTTIEVHNLFFNTPVRRKFLRSTQTELGHVGEAFTRIALAHPDKHFSLSHNGRTIHDLPATDDWRVRIAALLGSELAKDLIPLASDDADVHLRGYAASPAHSRANPRMQFLFLNGRAIRDRALQHALGEAFRGLLLTGRYPIACLRIDMPPEMVDVNVHPTKLEVRFQDAGRLYSQLLSTLRTKFLTTDLTHRLQPVPASNVQSSQDPFNNSEQDQMRRELNDWANGQLAPVGTVGPNGTSSFGAPVQTQFDMESLRARPPLEITRLDRAWPATPTNNTGIPSSSPPSPHRVSAMQVHNRYLIAESDEGVLVIDQHALHERILYEQLREKVNCEALESQSLLVPEPVDLTPTEAAAALEARHILAKLGVTVEPFGGSTVLVSSYPAMLANISPAQVLRDLVDLLMAGEKVLERRDVLDELLHMISCKAAIKAGDRLSGEEITALLDQRHLAQDQHHCPHGRPTALVFTREELDKQFMRT
jgi:DNA mismatch repair protein MutL